MKKLFVIVQAALSMLLALPSFAQTFPWNNESNRVRPRPVLRADQGLGVYDWQYGVSQNFMDPRWSTIVPQPVMRADQGLGVHDWIYEVYSGRSRRVYDPYGNLRHYYNQRIPAGYCSPNQGIIQLLQQPRDYYSPYRQRPSNVTILLDALLNPQR